jgi:altronate hydrolase
MNAPRTILRLHANDNVAVAAADLPADTAIQLDNKTLQVNSKIDLGHKVALVEIQPGQRVLKYGQPIGEATQPIKAGDWVHSHNLSLGRLSSQSALATEPPADPPPIADRTFRGYRRPDGRTGTRNYIGVISSVNCSASVAKYIARHFGPEHLGDFPNVDGVVAFTHTAGCGMQYRGSAHEMLNRVLAGMARHPNIGAYLFVGLGCEQGDLNYLLQEHQLVQLAGSEQADSRPPVLVMQEQGGTAKTVEAGIQLVQKLLPEVNRCQRSEVPASEIVLATECGGSDGNSGITANPALGVAADRIVACGGTAILSETSEIYGAEHLLTRRARSPQVAQKLIDRIEWWKWYLGLFGTELDNNPSVGNKAGGLTTIAEKSLGAVMKAGSTALVDVVEYAEPVTSKGLVVMDTPGYDPPSVTGMVAGGANVVVFTTGRGSCFGCKPVPTIKVASNSPMFRRMEEDMDLNAGVILDGASVASVGEAIFERILAVASGESTKSEQQGIGDDEFVPWTVGPML